MKNILFRFTISLTLKSLMPAALFLNFATITRAVGVLDSTFGTNGKVTTSVGNFAAAKSVVIQPDGKIVVAGDVFRDTTRRDIVLIRYNLNGSLDASFGDSGKVITTISNRDDLANAVAVQPDGKIIVVGTADSDGFTGGNFLVVRYQPNGSLDSDFGAGGVVIINQANTEVFNAVALQPDGKIVAAGRSADPDRAVVVRLNPNGILDSSFNAGLIYFDLPNYKNDNLQTVGVLPDNRIVIGGLADSISTQPVLLGRFARLKTFICIFPLTR